MAVPETMAVLRKDATTGQVTRPTPDQAYQNIPGYLDYVPGEVIVKFKPNIGSRASQYMGSGKLQSQGVPSLEALLQRYQVTQVQPLYRGIGVSAAATAALVRQKFPQRAAHAPKGAPIPDLENLYRVTMNPGARVLEAVKAFRKDPSCVYAHPNVRHHLLFVPNDPYFGSSGSWGQDYRDLWGLALIEAERAWDLTTGKNVVVAVIDTGVDYQHDDLRQNVWRNLGEIEGNGIDDDANGYKDDIRGWNFESSNNDPLDTLGHGSHVAGTIAATGNNGRGVIGLAFQSQVMPLKTSLRTDELVKALHYAADNGAKVISNSWGSLVPIPAIQEAVEYAYAQGCVIVAAAGNENLEDGVYPANYPQVISVAATTHLDQKAEFSSWGPKIDVGAPGGDSTPLNRGFPFPERNILSLRAAGTNMYRDDAASIVGTSYYRARGTSMATPHVSALAALILARHPEFTNEQVRQAIRTSAEDLTPAGWDPWVGYGRINAFRAVQVDSACNAKILSPPAYVNINDLHGNRVMDIVGTASGPGFQRYTVEYGRGLIPSAWVPLGQSGSPVEGGVLAAAWDTRSLPVGDYTLRLTVSGCGRMSPAEDRTLVKVTAGLQAGSWPYRLTYPSSEPVIADLDANGTKEVIVADDNGSLNVLDHTGRSLPGWPVSVEGLVEGMAVGDLFPNLPGQEVAVIMNGSDTGRLGVYRADGTLAAPLVSLPFQIGVYQVPVIADVDQDGQLNIVTLSSNWPQLTTTAIDVRSPDGTPQVSILIPDGGLGSNMAIGDLDQDRQLEIVVATKHKLSVFNHDGTSVAGWPKSGAYANTHPTLADLDGDGKDEIIIGDNVTHSVLAFKADGSSVPGWPVNLRNVDPFADPNELAVSVGDVDGDGFPEVVALYRASGTFGTRLVVINHDGTIAPGWPISTLLLLSDPRLADVDGDGDLEIVATSFAARWYAWHHDGTRVEGWPIELNTSEFDLAFSGVAMGDLDGDGDIELVGHRYFGGQLFAFDTAGRSRSRAWPWLMYRGGPARTGRASCPHNGDVDGNGQVTPRDALTAYQYVLRKTTLTLCQQERADVTGDGLVSSADATCIFNRYLGLPSCLP